MSENTTGVEVPIEEQIAGVKSIKELATLMQSRFKENSTKPNFWSAAAEASNRLDKPDLALSYLTLGGNCAVAEKQMLTSRLFSEAADKLVNSTNGFRAGVSDLDDTRIALTRSLATSVESFEMSSLRIARANQ